MMNIFDGRNPSHMNHDFSKVPHADIQRSLFRRNHTHKTTLNAGYLVPIYCDEVLPGDTFTLNMSVIARLTTPIVPIMDNIYMDFFFFYVPNRLLWDNWVKFMGEKSNPDDSTEYATPCIDFAGGSVVSGSIHDYLGVPLLNGINNNNTIVAFYHRAYNLIFNEWFRDQNLQDSVAVPKGNGPDAMNTYTLLRRGKRHDYFTSCLPWPQKGPGIELPLGDVAPVVCRGDREYTGVEQNLRFRNRSGGTYDPNPDLLGIEGTTGNAFASDIGSGDNIRYVVPANLWADLSDATAATINSFRQAIQLQRLLERDARSGTRYTEIIHGHFGITSPDSRLQRPEYLGGGTSPINIHSVPQTSNNINDRMPQGNMTAYGYVQDNRIGFSKSFVEHGVIIGLANVRADLTYQQGLNRMLTRRTKYDYYWPALAHLGEMPVKVRELYWTNTASDNEIFGYQEVWAEYRYHPSRISGLLRSTAIAPLDMWHLAQKFTSKPVLNASFITDNPPIDRVVAVQNQPHFVMDTYFDLKCARPMPVYSVPGLIDHF